MFFLLKMRKLAIVTDGSCDIPKKFVEKYQLNIIPFRVLFGTEVFQTFGDWGDLTKEEFYDKLKTCEEFPTTGIPPNSEIVKVMQKAVSEAESVIAIILSKNFSGMYQSVVKVVEHQFQDADITIIDSTVATSSLGVLVLEAARMVESGFSKDEIIERIELIKTQARLLVVLDSVDSVYRSGRVGWSKKFLVKSLKIKPIVNFVGGQIVSGGTLRGTELVLKRIKFAAPIILKNSITDHVVIWHVRNPKAAEEILEIMEANNGQNKELIVQEAGPLVGTHVGEKSIGIMYIGDYKKKWLLKMKE